MDIQKKLMRASQQRSAIDRVKQILVCFLLRFLPEVLRYIFLSILLFSIPIGGLVM